jgi:hypothetical protein
MKVFISWSGAKSRTVAESLRRWIPDIIQSVEPWMSGADIDAGARWSRNIEQQLSNTNFGILCLTRNNLTAPWILFEAGALAKTIDDTFVCPYLIDLNPTEIPPGPLTQFQAKRANEADTWELILTINKVLKEGALPEEKLKRTFERWWPDLEIILNTLPDEDDTGKAHRTADSMLEEMLELTREISRRVFSERSNKFVDLTWRGRFFKLHGTVRHPKYGEGTVVDIEKDAITVRFQDGEEHTFSYVGVAINELNPVLEE